MDWLERRLSAETKDESGNETGSATSYSSEMAHVQLVERLLDHQIATVALSLGMVSHTWGGS